LLDRFNATEDVLKINSDQLKKEQEKSPAKFIGKLLCWIDLMLYLFSVGLLKEDIKIKLKEETKIKSEN